MHGRVMHATEIEGEFVRQGEYDRDDLYSQEEAPNIYHHNDDTLVVSDNDAEFAHSSSSAATSTATVSHEYLSRSHASYHHRRRRRVTNGIAPSKSQRKRVEEKRQRVMQDMDEEHRRSYLSRKHLQSSGLAKSFKSEISHIGDRGRSGYLWTPIEIFNNKKYKDIIVEDYIRFDHTELVLDMGLTEEGKIPKKSLCEYHVRITEDRTLEALQVRCLGASIGDIGLTAEQKRKKKCRKSKFAYNRSKYIWQYWINSDVKNNHVWPFDLSKGFFTDINDGTLSDQISSQLTKYEQRTTIQTGKEYIIIIKYNDDYGLSKRVPVIEKECNYHRYPTIPLRRVYLNTHSERVMWLPRIICDTDGNGNGNDGKKNDSGGGRKRMSIAPLLMHEQLQALMLDCELIQKISFLQTSEVFIDEKYPHFKFLKIDSLSVRLTWKLSHDEQKVRRCLQNRNNNHPSGGDDDSDDSGDWMDDFTDEITILLERFGIDRGKVTPNDLALYQRCIEESTFIQRPSFFEWEISNGIGGGNVDLRCETYELIDNTTVISKIQTLKNNCGCLLSESYRTKIVVSPEEQKRVIFYPCTIKTRLFFLYKLDMNNAIKILVDQKGIVLCYGHIRRRGAPLVSFSQTNLMHLTRHINFKLCLERFQRKNRN